MLLVFIVTFLALIVISLKVKNKDIPDTPKIKTINKVIYSIWLLSFVFLMLNLGDESTMQIPAALIMLGVTILSMLSLIIIQIIKIKLKQ